MARQKRSDRKRRIEEEAVDWLLRAQGEPLGEEESRDLARWLEADSDHRMALEKAERLFGEAGGALASDPERTKRLVTRRSGVGRASSILLPLAILAGGFILADGPLRMRADVVSASGESPVLALDDGSTIRLNAETALANDYGADRRTVRLLRGEAFFDVERDPARPFVVEAGGGRIEVLGTAFNVNRIGDRTEVSVGESTVRVHAPGSGETVILEAGMRTSYDTGGRLTPVETVAEEALAPWREGRLEFDDEPLSSVLEEIFRHLPGDAFVPRAAIRDRRISGSFELSDPQAALDAFVDVFGLRMVRAGTLATIFF